MNLNDIITGLSKDQTKLPRKELESAVIRKDEIIPHLIKSIKDARDNYKTFDDNLPFYSVLLLSQFKCQESHEPICQLMKIPCDKTNDYLYNILSDLICENMLSVLANTYNGDIKYIKSVIECDTACIYARGAAMKSLVLLSVRRQISMVDTIDYFRSLLENGMKSYDIWFLYGSLISDCYTLKARELLPLIKSKFEAGMVDVNYIEFTEDMNGGEQLWWNKIMRCTHDPIKILEQWAHFRNL